MNASFRSNHCSPNATSAPRCVRPLTHNSCRATTAVVAAFAVALVMACSAPAAAQEPPCSTRDLWTSYANTNNIGYHVRLCRLPDYDQARKLAGGLGVKKLNVGGLPVDHGACHCVPTSFTNVLGYYASKGVKVKRPTKYDWNGRIFATQNEPATPAANSSYDTTQYPVSEASAYNSVTSTIRFVGQTVRSTSEGCGTSAQAVAKDADSLFAKLSQEVSFAYNFNGGGAQTPFHMAAALSTGATVIFGYSTYYTEPSSWGWKITGPREGGHMVTLRGIKGGTAKETGIVSYRDPATDEDVEGKVDRVRQSRFKTNVAELRMSANSPWLWQLGPRDDSTGKARFINSWAAIYPQILLSHDGGGFSYTGKYLNQGGSFASRAQSSAVPTVRRRFPVGRLADATYVAKTGEVVFARKGSPRLEAISIVSGARRVIGTATAGVVDLDTDARRGDVIALGGKGIARFDLDGGGVVRGTLPVPFDAVAYDPVNDSVAAVALKARKLRTLDAGSLAGGATRSLAGSATDGAGKLALSFDAKGGLLLRRAKSGAIRRLTARGRGQRPVTGSKIKSGKGLVGTDRGTLLTVIGGKITELTTDGKAVRNSPFRGRAGAGTLVSIIRSAADLDPKLANQLIDQRIEGQPAFNEFSKNPAPGPPPGIAVLPDSVADARVDQVP